MHPARNHTRPAAIGLVLGAVAVLLLSVVEPRGGPLIRNTLFLGLGAAAIAVPVGTVLALLLARTDAPWRWPCGCLLAGMLFVPLYLQAAGWDAGFGRQGWLPLAEDLSAAPLLAGWRAAIWIHALAAVPWVLLLVGIGVWYVEPELEEAALLEASSAHVFWRVTLRQSLPAVAVATLWVLLSSAAEMTVTDLYQVRTFAEEVYVSIPLGELDDAQFTLGTGLAVLVALTLIALVPLGYLAPPADVPLARRRRTFRLGAWRGAALLGLSLATLIVIAVPLVNLVIGAGLKVEQQGGDWIRSWSPLKCLQLVVSSPYRFREEFGWTLLVGGTAATVAVCLAGPLAWISRRGRAWWALALLLSAVCLATPGPLIGLSAIWLLNREGHELLIWLYDRTIAAPVLALVVRALPLSLLVSWYALRSVSHEQLDLAATEGAGALTRFARIAVPQRLTALAVAWLVSFAVAAGDLAASILVAPPGVTTVPIRVFGLLHAGVDDQVAGLCLAMLLATALIAAATIGLVYHASSRQRV